MLFAVRFPRPQEQHRRLGRLRLQPQRHRAGVPRALQVPGELALGVAALPQPQPGLSGKRNNAVKPIYIYIYIFFSDAKESFVKKK